MTRFPNRGRLAIGAVLVLGLAGTYACQSGSSGGVGAGDMAAAAEAVYVAPGEYDEFYAFMSGGFSGNVTVHATNGDIIDALIQEHRKEGKLSPLYHYLSQPEITEAEASARFCDMAHYTDVPSYIVHMTCEGALNAVKKASLPKTFRCF